MSLDVYLYDTAAHMCTQCGHNDVVMGREVLFHANITHNLTEMARLAGFYLAVWRPDELGLRFARDLIAILDVSLELLRCNPDKYKQHNPRNGFGSYDYLVFFLEKYLAACRKSPDAIIEVCR